MTQANKIFFSTSLGYSYPTIIYSGYSLFRVMNRCHSNKGDGLPTKKTCMTSYLNHKGFTGQLQEIILSSDGSLLNVRKII